MPNYRRVYIPGSTVFLTWVTYHRAPLFNKLHNINLLRRAIQQTKREAPFEIVAAAVLPDHLHFIWTLPAEDSNYSKRVGQIKVLFARALRGRNATPMRLSRSRRKHRERDVWQRRFWEHTIRSEEELSAYLDYVHYNPVKHGLASCPHSWHHSSFNKWVAEGHYRSDWACQCKGKGFEVGNILAIAECAGE
ncbi:MAG: transposase [Cyanobacteria bacterium P01_B01_bin.77]